MKLVSIHKQRVYQIVVDQIKQMIERGELKPGDRLPPERELAERLGVSRPAVREAMSVMEAIRLVRIQPGVGIFIEEDPNKDLMAQLDEMARIGNIGLIQLLEVRQALESQAAYFAALRRTEADVKAIRDAYERLRLSVERSELAAEEDYQFHLRVVEAACNPLLLETVKMLSERCLAGLYRSRSESIRIPGKSAAVLKEHLAICEAIAGKEPHRAQKEMWQHLQNVKSRYF